jgi:hypothetical protein
MPATPISDAELALVAAVAAREGWDDLAAPPGDHPPRTIGEQLAVARFDAALPRRRARTPRASRIRARLALVALAVVVLGACWWVSPTRTAIGLLAAGVFSLVALRRGRRDDPRDRRPARHPFSGAIRTG